MNIAKRLLPKSRYYRRNEDFKEMKIEINEEENEEFLVKA
jgi:hypothetical protein